MPTLIRVARGDVDAMTDMTKLRGELDDAISQAVTGLLVAGYSWTDIGAPSTSPVQFGAKPWRQRRCHAAAGAVSRARTCAPGALDGVTCTVMPSMSATAISKRATSK